MADIIQKNKSKIILQLEIIMLKEDDTYIAYCPALELSSYGKTAADAKKYFDEALEIFIEETGRKGTFEKELLKYGWTLTAVPKADYKPPITDMKRVRKISKNISTVKTQRVRIPNFSFA